MRLIYRTKRLSATRLSRLLTTCQNRIVIPPSVGQRNIVVRSKTIVLINTPEGEKARRWVDADTVTREGVEMFFAETPDDVRVHVVRQAVNPLSLHERQARTREEAPKDTTAKRADGLGSETSEGAVEA